MRIQSSVTAISWIPSEAVEGLPKLPFTMGVAHYDYPPPDRIDHLETMHRADLFREANELQAWIEVEDGKITDYGQTGARAHRADQAQAGAQGDRRPRRRHADAPERRGR